MTKPRKWKLKITADMKANLKAMRKIEKAAPLINKLYKKHFPEEKKEVVKAWGIETIEGKLCAGSFIEKIGAEFFCNITPGHRPVRILITRAN